MYKIIFLGTDLHTAPTELAAKTVKNVKSLFPGSHIVSIQHRKPFVYEKGTSVVPRLCNMETIRKIVQATTLPFLLIYLRFKGYEQIYTFWTANTYYHRYLFYLLKKIGYKLIFTIISGKETNIESCKIADRIICQSDTMAQRVKERLPKSNVIVIKPGVDLSIFRTEKKKIDMIIPSVPYMVKDFEKRGIDVLLSIIKEEDISALIICRSKEAYEYIKNQNLKNVTLYNRVLADIELAHLMGQTKMMPLFYKESPDVPLSIIEGLASGCAIICTDKVGIAKEIVVNGAGRLANTKKELLMAIKIILKNQAIFTKRATMYAQKEFSLRNLEQYVSLLL